MSLSGYLRQSTAVTILIGPFVDNTDGDTEETGLTIAQADVRLSKNGGNMAQKNDATGCTHDELGYYTCPLNTTDTDTVGILTIAVHDGDALLVENTYQVLEESTYDTEYASDAPGPASSTQVDNIGAASGGAFNFEASEDNTGGAIDPSSAAFVGSVQGGTYESTATKDGVVHDIDDTGNDIDIVYGFDIGGGRKASSVRIIASMADNTDEIKIKAYDHVGTTWDTIETLEGGVGTPQRDLEPELLSKHSAGTGAEAGKVYIRFETDSTTPSNLSVDMIVVKAVISTRTVGYSDGAIWVNTNASNTNTEDHIDGTADNPVSTWAAAKTLSASLGIKRFHVINGSSITLDANSDNYTIIGDAWTLALGGQSIEGLSVEGATVTGIGTATVTQPEFKRCKIGAATIPPSILTESGIGNASGQFTAGSAGQYLFHLCYSLVPGSGSPTLVFAGLGPSTGINNRGWKGGSTYTLDSDCTLSHEVLAGGGTTITTGGADVEIRGITRSVTLTMSAAETVQFVGTTGPITLNGTTTATVNLYGVSASLTDSTSAATVTDSTVSNENVADDVWDEALTAATHNVATSAGRRLRDLASSVIHSDTAQGAGTGNNQIQLDTGASSTDGAYDPSLVSIVSGTGVGQTRLILEYDGATRTATVDRNWKVNPDATSGFVITAHPGRNHVNEGLAQAGSNTTITLNALASASDDAYNGQMIFIRSGTGEDQVREVLDYDGTTKIATVTAWDINPDSTSGYAMIPFVSSPDMETDFLDLADGVESSLTVRQALRLIVASAAGKLSGGGTTTIVIRDTDDSVDRITATVDASGNRSAVTTNLS